MTHLIWHCVVFSIVFVIASNNLTTVHAQPAPAQQALEAAQKLPLRPKAPGGYLSATLGTYLTIEGVLYDGNGKVESNSLAVDAVNGRKLDKPILIRVSNVILPAKQRCVLKGYELGGMIGRPPAEYALTKELGNDPAELANRDAVGWQWRPYFVPMIAVEPKGLKTSTRWGIQN